MTLSEPGKAAEWRVNMKKDLIIIHGGGPTAVLNCSLYGAIMEAKASGEVGHIWGAVCYRVTCVWPHLPNRAGA
jgi:hypothetical protein